MCGSCASEELGCCVAERGQVLIGRTPKAGRVGWWEVKEGEEEEERFGEGADEKRR